MTSLNKPYSESCDQNRAAILSIIQPLLGKSRRVLEIGSGTGQHAVAFAAELPQLIWQTSDQSENHAGIRLWLEESRLDNIRAPLVLDVMQAEWPDIDVDAVFTANTLHIMHWSEVEALFDGIGQLLSTAGNLLIYGPFNYGGKFTSDSNVQFDQWLKSRDPLRGIRDFEAVDSLASKAGLVLKNDYTMPANNRILHWQMS